MGAIHLENASCLPVRAIKLSFALAAADSPGLKLCLWKLHPRWTTNFNNEHVQCSPPNKYLPVDRTFIDLKLFRGLFVLLLPGDIERNEQPLTAKCISVRVEHLTTSILRARFIRRTEIKWSYKRGINWSMGTFKVAPSTDVGRVGHSKRLYGRVLSPRTRRYFVRRLLLEICSVNANCFVWSKVLRGAYFDSGYVKVFPLRGFGLIFVHRRQKCLKGSSSVYHTFFYTFAVKRWGTVSQLCTKT